MPTVMTNSRELLTLEQRELYDGVLTECQQNRETAVVVLDRYDRLIEEQLRDVAAVRKALRGAGATEIPVRMLEPEFDS
ncbi:MAG TPA: hypothetical protein VFC00_04850 [Micromonosporaceae bacterium]|nr:hypothetical protein [Micromonosporaceae bacterium]